MTSTIASIRTLDAARFAGLLMMIIAGGCTSARSRGLPMNGQDSGSPPDAVVDHPADASGDLGRGGDAVVKADAGSGSDAGSVCGASTHSCVGICVANSDVANCGMACVPCPVPTGGSATCDGTTCGGTCPSGMKLCAGACIDAAASCAGACASGTHDCAGICQPNASPNTCGTSCTACLIPAQGTATCDGTACGFTCNTGYHACGSSCASSTSVASCGSSCTACPVPTGGSATCDGMTCGGTCPSGMKLCAGVCVPRPPRRASGVCPSVEPRLQRNLPAEHQPEFVRARRRARRARRR